MSRSKAKSGLSAVRMFPETVVEPPNNFVGGATSFTTGVRDGKGHASLHAGAVNTTAFTLKILHSWRSTGPFTLDQSVASVVDSETGKHVAEVIQPISKRFLKVVVTAVAPGLNADDFELGAYFLPRTPVAAIIVSGSGGGGVTTVKGSPGTVITTPADTVVAPAATVALPAAPADTRRRTVQVTGGDSTTRIRVREVGAGAGRGKLLDLLGSTIYGGADGAIAALEVENVAGPASAVMAQDERD